MRNLLLILLTLSAAFGLACTPQTQPNANTNANANANANANRAVNTSDNSSAPDGIKPLMGGAGQANRFDEEETAVITVRRVSGTQNSAMPCEITIDKERIKLLTDDARGKSKVDWQARNECTENNDRFITVEIQFPKASPFGAEGCDRRLLIDYVKRNRRKRFVSKTATAGKGIYKYDIHAYYTGTNEKVAPSLDPEIEIGGNSVSDEAQP